MTKLLLTAPLAVLIGTGWAHASSDWRDIQVGENSLLYTENLVTVRGQWVALGEYQSPLIPVINVAHIQCDRNLMRCTESQAQIAQLSKRPAESSPYVVAHTFYYQIEQWSNRDLIAKRINPYGGQIDSVLIIDSRSGLARIEWRDRPSGDRYFFPSEQQFKMVIKNHYGA